jgi:hypothetical protein
MKTGTLCFVILSAVYAAQAQIHPFPLQLLSVAPQGSLAVPTAICGLPKTIAIRSAG